MNVERVGQKNGTPVRGRDVENSRVAGWLAWLSLFISFVLTAASVVYLYRNRAAGIASNDYWAANAGTAVMYPIVGALIISRRTRHVIGWLFCMTGILNAIVVFGSEYGAYGLVSGHESLPGALLLAWLDTWLWVPAAVPVILLILLFPEGRPLYARWWNVAWAALVGTVLLSVAIAFHAGPLVSANINNPYALASWQDLLDILALMGGACLVVALIASLASLILRGRRSAGQERQQLKWFVYAGIVSIALFFGGTIADSITNRNFFSPVGNALAFPLLPAALGVAILRYRLYDIDLLINRTLVYVPLTAILAGIFAASITLTQRFFVALTGQSSDAATVLTTLIVVAAIDPLKNGLQHLVDRRFKEAPDPTKTLKAFDQQVQSFIQMADREAITRRLLDEASHAFDARNGALFLSRDGKLELVQSCGDWSGEAKINVPLQSSESGTRIGLVALGPRRNGLDYTPQDRETLQQIAMHVARVIALMGYLDGVRQ